jgi:hypothetical protein
MHPTTAQYLAKAHHQDLETQAAKGRLAAEARRANEARKLESDDLRPTRWGIRLPRLTPRFRRSPAAGAATA